MGAVAEGSRLCADGRIIAWAFTGRAGGVSEGPFASLNLADYVGDDPNAVRRNRSRAAGFLGLAPDAIAMANAVHGGNVAEVTQPGEFADVDALVTVQEGVGLLALAADCVPLALLDDQAGVVGAVHCGWKGLGAGIVAEAVARMRAIGARSLQAVIGPHVCASCYPVDPGRVDELRSTAGSLVAEAASTRRASGWHIDVGAGVRCQLHELGVPAHEVGGCTVEEPGLFSYRRDGVTGRQAVIVALLRSATPGGSG